tara:strand:+ start:1153 stop:2328 length:1176 start_codon:yes stop_codon:yes gene_type:complete
MSFPEAIKAIPADLALHPNSKLKRSVQIAKLFIDEAKGILSMVPYGVRCQFIHKFSPKADARDGEMMMRFKETKVSLRKDFKYGEEERQKFDVYLPSLRSIRRKKDVKFFDDDDDYELEEDVSVRRKMSGMEASMSGKGVDPSVPMAVFVHGGVWSSGERWQFAPLAHRLAEEGIVTAVISYTLYPQKSAKAQSEEVLKALKCAIMNAKLFGADANRTHLVGHSAGSHLCAMALLLDDEKQESKKLKSFVGMCGVYNIATHYEYEDKRGVAMLSTMGRAMGGQDKFKEMSPFHILENSSSSSSNEDNNNNNNNNNNLMTSFPTTYLFTSDADIVVPMRESEDFHKTLRKVGVQTDLKVYDHGTHGEFALGFKKHPKPLKVFHRDLIELLHS